jgi:uncharacterized peroxidase-related enzyme
MVMAQGFSQQEVKSILDDVEKSSLIDEKTKAILRFAEKVTKYAYKITEADIQKLREIGFTDEDILEATEVISLFNFLDRIADALGAPVENIQQAMSNRTEN